MNSPVSFLFYFSRCCPVAALLLYNSGRFSSEVVFRKLMITVVAHFLINLQNA